ncbi:hypothetical protein D3C87_1821410 [compost metagenome]
MPLQFEQCLHRPGEIVGAERRGKVLPAQQHHRRHLEQEVCGEHDGLRQAQDHRGQRHARRHLTKQQVEKDANGNIAQDHADIGDKAE